MKIKPIVTDHIKTKHTSFEVDLKLDYNVTFISGDSGTGKSALYSFLQVLSRTLQTTRPPLSMITLTRAVQCPSS